MRFTAVFISLVALAVAVPVPEKTTSDLDTFETTNSTVIPITEYGNDLEARGSTPWHDCSCGTGYLTDADYSSVYTKTLSYGANFDGSWIPSGYGVFFVGPSKNFLTVEVVGPNSQQFSRDRVGNIIHQLKVARGNKGCGTRPVSCWTQGAGEIKAWVNYRDI